MYDLPVEYHRLSPRDKRAVRNQYIVKQSHKCFFCGESLNDDPPKHIKNASMNKRMFPKGMLNYPIHLQHDHRTGLTEGAVHAKCNAYWWEYKGR